MIAPSPFQSVPLSQAYRLLNHGPTVLVSSAHGDRRNVMAAAWNMPLDFDPPKVAVVIDKATLTRELIEASGQFVLAIPGRDLAERTLAAGSCSGREGDKFEALGLDVLPASQVQVPLPAGCIGWLECRVIDEPHIQRTYDLFLGEVVAAWADSDMYSAGRWHFPEQGRSSIHYVSGGQFFATGEAFEVDRKA
ncbi:MAG: flavin reductase family protein [Zoogloea sp.]|uniref:flavin reductase family protein n=1 Tax=Zoogloea sp. TaxID=49181 RepID=UPI00262D82E2|nr:flavin reductase family protein [Zoogloea sp.]MDD2988841.1 flavin reductase family protein [Zoogloea sp.]